MGKYDGILICTDIDGTLTYEAGKTSRENLEAIKYFISEGGLFTIASGRFPQFIIDLGVPVSAPILAFNGSLIYDSEKGKIIKETFLENSVLGIIYKCYKELKDKTEFLKYYAKDGEFSTDINGEGFIETAENVYKAVFVAKTPEDGLFIRDFLKKNENEYFEVSRSWPVGIEIISKNGNKAKGGLFLKELLGAKTYISVGDFENDISMLRAADISYAVDNASDEIKAVAKRIAPKNTDHAIKFIIENL